MGSIDNTSFNTYVLRCITQHKLTNISSFAFSFPSQKRKSIWNARDIILRHNLLLIRHRLPIVSCSSPHEICKSFIYRRVYLNLSMTFIKHSKRTWWCFCSLFPWVALSPSLAVRPSICVKHSFTCNIYKTKPRSFLLWTLVSQLLLA